MSLVLMQGNKRHLSVFKIANVNGTDFEFVKLFGEVLCCMDQNRSRHHIDNFTRDLLFKAIEECHELHFVSIEQ